MSRRAVLLILPWLVIVATLSPFIIGIQNHFVYSDSPFLTTAYQSVKVNDIMKEYFNLTQRSEIFVIVNGSYNTSLEQVESKAKILEDAVVINPFNIISQENKTYFSTINPIVENYTKELLPLHNIYVNAVKTREILLQNLSWFEYQLNVTYGFPLGKEVRNTTYLQEFLKNYEGHNLTYAGIAGYKTFKDPFVLFFSFSNYTNSSLIKDFLNTFSNYSLVIKKVSGISLPEEAIENPRSYVLMRVEQIVKPPPITISNFHRGDSWLFIVTVPRNESLTKVQQFIQSVNGLVTGHFPIYAQSAYYTGKDIEVIDVVTVALVGFLLAILLRSLLPILLLISSAVIGLVIGYSVLYSLTLFGYSIYYISGLVIPPIVFGITIDYSILLMYRYFEELRKGTKNPLTVALKTAGRGATFSGLSITLAFSTFILSTSPLLRNIGEALVVASLSSLIPAILFTFSMLKILPIKWLGFPRKEVPNPIDARQKYLEKSAKFAIKWKYLILALMVILVIGSFFVIKDHPTNVAFTEIVPSTSETVEGEKFLSSMFNYSTDYILFKGNPNSTYANIALVSQEVIRSGGLAYGPASLGTFIIPKPSYVTDLYYSHNYSYVEALIPYPVFSSKAINFTQYLINQGFMVGGSNANRIDIVNNTVGIYFSFVLPLTIIAIAAYLFLVLRSIVIPLRLVFTLAISSLVGVGVMDIVFGSVYWLSPLIVFAILFSLGIDYDLFIVLRIREERKTNEDDRIVAGVKNTGLVVTAAGLILSGAFFSLVTADMRFLQEIGFSVGFSVLFDTFIVRPILVPAIMSILKKYNWWPGERNTA
ncbi:antibiotic transporter [Candidatus Acidianus copahuensis]|uniref:Antibiotic transporter n=1 Tax=Candidatus Acidianus copahuensis TaxID=1160895 RepID=A0A031LIE2_9CREN|nr:MMPL family transporter [Candidatus Acidianus copahuensis]EZQ01887.1 antibiotic transporter [Candidatus Acidianus copahuensis]